MRILIIITITTFLSGCSSFHYKKINIGELHGKLLVQWIDYDKFIFIPDKTNPLTFTRHNKQKISPQKMYTDGGSIPRPLWAFRSYSPWGYAPAFIVHDWLFVMHHCKHPGYEEYDVEEAAWVMSEIMKTMMQQNKNILPSEKLATFSMFKAVSSPIAKKLWNDGKCETPSTEAFTKVTPIAEYVIEFK